MLNADDRRAIEGLFSRIADVERRTPDRDPDAEQLIAREIARQPGAPYYMAQTVLVQEHALEVADTRIRELERQLEEANSRTRADTSRPRGPWDRDDRAGESSRSGRGLGGGGFLAGAAQTAMGVAGGVLLGSAIGSMFGGGAAHAAETPPEPAPQPEADATDDGGDGDFGGDGFDGFDMGGDF